MSIDRRKYDLKARAVRQRQTRERIVKATAALHRQVGPARTTVADIARRAGVQRLTVYNHFPKLGDLLGACQHAFLTENPPPDLAPAPSRRGAAARLEQALLDLYKWYRANAAIEHNVHRDRPLVAELDELMSKSADPPMDAAAAQYAELLASTRASVKAVRCFVRLAFRFETWESMADCGLTDKAIASLMRRAVAGVA